jgi:hypothetical protein
MFENWKLTIPQPLRMRPVVETLRDLARAHPGILLFQTVVPEDGLRPAEVYAGMVEKDLAQAQSSLPEGVIDLLKGSNFFWGYDDLGFVVVMLVDQENERLGPVYQESEEGGLPIGRPSAGIGMRENH